MKSTHCSDGPLSRILAEYTTKLSLPKVPEAVVAYARYLLLDLFGAALAGVETEEVQAASKAAHNFGAAQGPCTLWGTPHSTTPAGAAMVNGIASHARELDDFGGVDHTGAVVIPALCAVGEARPPLSGAQFLEAMVVGYEVGRRVLDAAGGYRPHNHSDGWHSTGTCGAFAAAAAAAKALRLDAQKTAWALGLAGTYTGGTWAFLKDGAMSKRFHAGRAAETGLVAAFLAEAGFTGPIHIFEADWGGFFGTYARSAPASEKLTENLGDTFFILRSGIKPYASCRDIHSTLDVVLDIRKRYAVMPADIARIVIRCIPEMKQMVGMSGPFSSRPTAQLSLPYSVAVALANGRASLSEYEEPWLSDPKVRKLAQRVEMIVDPGLPFDSEPHVAIHTKDGRIFRGHVDFASGAPQNPLSLETIENKFEGLAGRVLSEKQVQRLKETVLSVPSLPDVRHMTDLLKIRV